MFFFYMNTFPFIIALY